MSTAATADVAARLRPQTLMAELNWLSEQQGDQAGAGSSDLPARSRVSFGCVWTIYYDTPGLESLGEKINSDYLKRKLRLRWYSDLEGRPTGPTFIEAKMRHGNRRTKVRVRLPHPADELARWDLQDPRLRAFPAFLREQGIVIGIGENWLRSFRFDTAAIGLGNLSAARASALTPTLPLQRSTRPSSRSLIRPQSSWRFWK